MCIPLYKLFLCVAVYAIPLALLSRHEIVGLFYGLAIGTSLSGVILLTNRDNIGNVVNVYLGGILGALLGVGCLGQAILAQAHGFDHGFGESAQSACTGGALGAIVGGYIASGWIRRRRQNGADDPQSEHSPSDAAQ
jgi:hypothetical protein